MKSYIFSNDALRPFEVEVGSLDMAWLKGNLRDLILEVFSEDIDEALNQYDPAPCGCFHKPYDLMTQVYGQAQDFLTEKFKDYTLYGRTVEDDGTVHENALSPKVTDILADLIQMRAENNDVVDHDLGPFLIAGLKKFIEQGTWHTGMIRDDDASVMADPKTWPKPEHDQDGLVWKDGDILLIPSLWFGLEGDYPEKCWTLSRDTGFLNAMGDFFTFNWSQILNFYEDTVTVWMFARLGLPEPDPARALETCPLALNEEGYTADDLPNLLNDMFLKIQEEANA